MASIAHKRKESDYFRSVAEIISEEVTNANISYPTVTGVKLSPDGSHLFVYLSFVSNEQRSLEALNGVRGYIRKRLATSSKARITPQLHFELDDSFEAGHKIEEILERIKENK